jgi:hypothetical protein
MNLNMNLNLWSERAVAACQALQQAAAYCGLVLAGTLMPMAIQVMAVSHTVLSSQW